MSEPALIVISDLHMGSGIVDDFEPEIEKHLVAFLEHWREEGSATELVINGDLLDFVQAPPYKGNGLRGRAKDGTRLCFTQDQSRTKLKAIQKDHEASFDALGAFLACRQENRVVLLPGNHDADFFWPGVREDFSRLVCGTNTNAAERLVYWLDRVYQPYDGIWIEHGQQYDPVNAFFFGKDACWSAKRPPLCKDRDGIERLYECTGTRFLIKYLNDLDAKYPYVDNIKPFWRFLQLFGASALKPGYGPLKATVAVAAMMLYLTKTLVTSPKDVLALETEAAPSAAGAVLAAFKKSTPSCQKAFIQGILDRKIELSASPEIVLDKGDSAASVELLGSLADNLDLLDIIDPFQPGGKLELLNSFGANETNELRDEALKIVRDPKNKTQTVIMGHTHEVVKQAEYINTGSWTRYYKLGKGDHLRSWEVLRKEGWKDFPYELNYALALRDAPARLETFYAEGAV